MDIIQLLPDAIANQIAAGEVIQRPASVVKELMENAVDAGATWIQVLIRQAGKQLIQVVDNGKGMSETDARLCFERHATSKIKQAEDLFHIRTKGFRGEALASIASVAQVELRTRPAGEDLATLIQIAASKVEKQEYCQAPEGTSLAVKNLFFNVPARRNFLKSDPVEMRHIVEEFHRIAIAHPQIGLELFHQEEAIYRLPAQNLRQRLVALFGKAINEKLVPVEEETNIVRMQGFIAKPDYAKKSRGEQYFFVNQRFIKSPYLNHAVKSAYEQLLPEDHYPFYTLFLEIDPERIDVNVHPTKTEIKFQEERLIYNLLKASVKHALGQFQIVPTLDFEAEGIQHQHQTGRLGQYAPVREQPSANWRQLYEGLDNPLHRKDDPIPVPIIRPSKANDLDAPIETSEWGWEAKEPVQILLAYILVPIKSGMMLIDQQAAHERILYEQYLDQLSTAEVPTQRALFPATIELSGGDAHLLKEFLPKINQLGFEVEEFGGNTFIIHGLPAQLHYGDEPSRLIEQLLEELKQNRDLKLDVNEQVARSLAVSAACKRGTRLSTLEMQEIIDHLFACELPFKSPAGRNSFITLEKNKLERLFLS
ncbi:MAG: DNA mismatch repair endonuclease MutL [Saprospiraceae bacterium]|nr:DNA mismatch repair endonuclease MutL [Saprospiraceae bacterium]